MSIETIIESLENNDDTMEYAYRVVKADYDNIVMSFHKNTHAFGLLKGKPYIKLSIDEYLSDDAKIDDEKITLVESGVQVLQKFFIDFATHYKKPFMFWSMWAGEEFNATVNPITPTHLQHLIQSQSLSQKEKYKITN